MYAAGTAGPYAFHDLARKNAKFTMNLLLPVMPRWEGVAIEAKQHTYRDFELKTMYSVSNTAHVDVLVISLCTCICTQILQTTYDVAARSIAGYFTLI